MTNTVRSLLTIFGFLLLLVIGIVFLANQVKKLSTGETIEIIVTPSPEIIASPTLVVTPTETEDEKDVLLYFVDIDDNGQKGLKIGCNDSLVSVIQKIDNTATPMTVALEKLLEIEDQTVGSNLYNSLYQSNLTLDKATITSEGVAEVYLSGELKLGGTCDAPRAQAQLEQTIMQFSSVHQAKIYLNNQPLEDALSTR